MSLTIIRAHQYAVWIAIGFFEVESRGDVGMIALGKPQLAFDNLGPEIGLLYDSRRRYRGFFLVDRLKLDGFDPTNPGPLHSAVLYLQSLP